MRLKTISATILTVIMLCWDGTVLAHDLSCPEVGSTFRPNPEGREERYVYRLKINAAPLIEDPMGTEERWQFQMLDRREYKVLVTLRLREGCPTGGLCSIWQNKEGDKQDVYSNIIRLTDAFEQPTDWSAPKAIVLPGFALHPWPATKSSADPTSLIYSDPTYSLSLPADIVWVRIACDHNAF